MSVKHYLLIVLLYVCTTLSAQQDSTTGQLRGKILDTDSRQPIEFANLQLELKGIVKTQAQTDPEGNYSIINLTPGFYRMKISHSGKTMIIDSIEIIKSTVVVNNVSMKLINELSEVLVVHKKPLVESTSVTRTLTSKQIMALPQRNVSSISGTKAGVDSRNGNSPSVKGARNDGTAYYIDGIRVKGGTRTNIHQNAIDAPGEKYKTIEENTYSTVKENPLSTFSIDVDKASYANVRRFIQSNSLPPADAVRVEEMINYFSYDAGSVKGAHPFSVNTEVADAPWSENKKLVYINLKAPEIEMNEASPNNLTFLIDVSGSMMSADKLPLLKESMKLLVEKMRDQDKISIVVYAGAAGLVLEPTNGKHKDQILEALNKLEAGGSTAGGAGIELAYRTARESFNPKHNNRIILATDGDFNVGISDVNSLVKLIEKKRESGIYLSVLGLGTGNYNDEMMESLADKGNGNYNYIDNLLEGKKVLVKEMGGTLYTVAKDVKIQIEFNPKFVKSYKLIGYENRMLKAEDFNNDKKDAGELGAGHCVTAIYEIMTTKDLSRQSADPLKYQQSALTEVAQGNELMNVKIRYKKPSESESIKFEVPVLNNENALKLASNEMRFAMSVALFGLKLRGSDAVKKISYDEIIAMGKASKGMDDDGYRAEFIRLVETAQLLATR